MWECRYGKEPLDMRLFVLRLIKKLPVLLFAAALGALCVGGSYFLIKVTFAPAKEYEAVTDFYVDYALKEDGEEYIYFNASTWNQMFKDDVLTDRILTHMSGVEAAVWPEEAEKKAGITKEELRQYIFATVLSDTRIVTTTVKTKDQALTMRIEKAVLSAMFDFGKQQKEIAEVRILQEPKKASLVVKDARVFRACMAGVTVFVLAAALYLCLYYTLDEGIHVPAAFERRFGIPMLGTIGDKALPVLALKLLPEKPALFIVDKNTKPAQVKRALLEKKIETAEAYRLEELFENPQADISGKKLLFIVKAGAHNGKQIEKALAFCEKCGASAAAALLWEADEKLIRAYELPEHIFHAWGRIQKESKTETV